eukprot:TRINITY_DN12672_c0_g1_i1.p1 TRINITY_DN12672_c0_g1~~TRINITY_DN12672_c0_g1_i1.p1  ORF type:complete len:909 (-),score=244.52 TRINITY_DN12672_c0_g1_i1:96-2822(-)
MEGEFTGTMDSVVPEQPQKKKKPEMLKVRDNIIRKTVKEQSAKGPSPLAQLEEVFEETSDRDRFVGDTMFWKYFEDISINRIKHVDSVEFRNLLLMFFETIFFVVVLVVFMLYAYNIQSMNVYFARNSQKEYWGGCDAVGQCSINGVTDMTKFWHWMHHDFMDLAFTKYPASPPDVADILTGFPSNQFPIIYHPRFVGPEQNSVLLGTIRMRQLRVEKNTGCSNSKLIGHYFPDCYAAYSSGVESERYYASRFAPTYLTPAFNWKSNEENIQHQIIGELATYGGGGFRIDLPENNSDTSEMLNDLWHWRWVDRSTRAVIFELSTLNVNVNVVVNTRILFEFGPTGTVMGSVQSKGAQVHFFTPSTKDGTEFNCLMLAIVLFILFLLYSCLILAQMYKTCVNYIGQSPLSHMRRLDSCGQRITFLAQTLMHYFAYGWNICDIVILGLYYAHLYFRMNAYYGVAVQDELQPDVIGHPEYFMPVAWVMTRLTYAQNTLSMLSIVIWVKPFKYLNMMSFFRMLCRIIEQCTNRLAIFSIMLVIIIFGFAVAFFVGFGSNTAMFAGMSDSFLILFFLLLDGYPVNPRWFDIGRLVFMPFVFFMYIVVIYFVLLNIFVAVVLDVYATSTDNKFVSKKPPPEDNPMAVFMKVYWNYKRGHSCVVEESEHNMQKFELSIPLGLLPGIVRRKWIEKKRKMQRIAKANFAGLELFPGEDYLKEGAGGGGKMVSDWSLPSSRLEIAKMMNPKAVKNVSMYEIPEAALQQEISRAQLQRLMNEDETLPWLLHETQAVEVIRRFKREARRGGDGPSGPDQAGHVRGLQSQVFASIDRLEAVPPEQEAPELEEIKELTETLSSSITDVRNQFRHQLTSVIEATAVLFEHLVDLTQGLDSVRTYHDEVCALVRENMDLYEEDD